MEGINWGRGGRLAAVIWLGRKEHAERDGGDRYLATADFLSLLGNATYKYTIWERILNFPMYLNPPLAILQETRLL